MTDKLFVYGTLMAAFRSGMAEYLKQRARRIGKGTVPGYLLDLGRYPGLLIDTNQAGRVEGDIFELYDPPPTLDTLDAYEGIDPDRPDEAEYRRECHPVQGPNETFLCWTYVFNGPPENFTVIPEGRYVPYARRHPAHRAFTRPSGPNP